MQKWTHDIGRAIQWRAMRGQIRTAGEADRYRLLLRFGDEMRLLAPMAAKASAIDWDVNVSLEFAAAVGTLVGGCLNAWPGNPFWIGRDRLYVCRRNDLLVLGCGLSLLGFFPTDKVADFVDDALAEGSQAALPGLEPGVTPATDLPRHAWESALESERSKRRWAEALEMGSGANPEWADRDWLRSPGVWRTYILLEATAPEAFVCRDLPLQEPGVPSSLVALAYAPRNEASRLAEEWRAAGWETVVVSRSDCLGLYQTLTAPSSGKPLAVMLAAGQAQGPSSSLTSMRRKDSQLLGEMSDEQFSSLVGESLQF